MTAKRRRLAALARAETDDKAGDRRNHQTGAYAAIELSGDNNVDGIEIRR